MTAVASNPVPIMVPLKAIRVKPGRARKQFNRMFEMAESIKANGLISPLYVTDDPDNAPDGKILVAGERRWRACLMAGLEIVPVAYRDKMDELQQKIVELEENICREDLDWQEIAENTRQIHELKMLQDPTWTQEKTAELCQIHKTTASRQIAIAKEIRASPEAKAMIKGLDFNGADKVLKEARKIKAIEGQLERKEITITSTLQHGDCTELIKQLPTHSVDLLCTDPPYGLEGLEDIREGSGAVMPGHVLMSEFHNMEISDVLVMLRKLAPELHRVLKPGAHMYVFCASQYVGDFIKALEPMIFCPPCLYWLRDRNTTIGLGYRYMSKIETIIYGHNPPLNTRRLAKNMLNVLEYPGVPNNQRSYPTEKPSGLLKTLITQSSSTGDTVLDPFAGSASTLKAAKALGRKSVGFEINEDSWKIGQSNLNGEKELA